MTRKQRVLYLLSPRFQLLLPGGQEIPGLVTLSASNVKPALCLPQTQTDGEGLVMSHPKNQRWNLTVELADIDLRTVTSRKEAK